MQTSLMQMKNTKHNKYATNYAAEQQEQPKSKSKKRKPDYSQQRQQKRGE